MTIQDVVIHTSEGLQNAPQSLRQSARPITARFDLAADLWVGRLDQKVADKVFDSCEPPGYGLRRPTRQYGQLYAFIRDLEDQGDKHHWDSD